MWSRVRGRPGAAIVAIGIAVVVGAWVIPTFAGRALVEVRARIIPVTGEPLKGASIVLPDGTLAASDRLRVEIEIINHYPLAVVVDFRGAAFRARLTGRDASNRNPVWSASVDDPLLEQADESPGGDTSSRVISVAPGTTLLSLAGAVMTLDLATVPVVAPGIYSLDVSAYGIAGSPQLLSIVADAAVVDAPAGAAPG